MSTERVKLIEAPFQDAINRKMKFRERLDFVFEEHNREVRNYETFWQGPLYDRFASEFFNEHAPRYQSVVACFNEQIREMEHILRGKQENDMNSANSLLDRPTNNNTPNNQRIGGAGSWIDDSALRPDECEETIFISNDRRQWDLPRTNHGDPRHWDQSVFRPQIPAYMMRNMIPGVPAHIALRGEEYARWQSLVAHQRRVFYYSQRSDKPTWEEIERHRIEEAERVRREEEARRQAEEARRQQEEEYIRWREEMARRQAEEEARRRAEEEARRRAEEAARREISDDGYLITRFREQFDGNGSYGGNQGSPAHNWEHLSHIVRRRFPGMTDNQVLRYLQMFNQVGCAYVGLATSLFTAFRGREEDFQRTFGFPMRAPNGDLNYDAVAVDFFRWLAHEQIAPPELHHDRYEYAINNGRGKNERAMRETWEAFLQYYGVGVTVTSNLNVTRENFAELKKHGDILLLMRPLSLHSSLDGTGIYDNRADYGHAVTVTGVTDCGWFSVSTWGQRWYVDPVANIRTFRYMHVRYRA